MHARRCMQHVNPAPASPALQPSISHQTLHHNDAECLPPAGAAPAFLSQNNNFSGTFVSPLVRGSNLHIAHLGNNNFTVFALSGAHLSNLDLQFNEYANASLTQFTSLVSLESLDTQNDVYSVSVWVGGERDCSGHSRSHAQGHAPQERVVYL